MIADFNRRNPILVTGAHRSGTTWVGKMLTASREAAYFSEPLNRNHRPGVLNAPVKHWYPYICTQNEREYYQPFRRMFSFRYHAWEELKSLRSTKDALRMWRDWGVFLAGWLLNRRPLMKDPFAFFSSPWLAERFGCQVIFTVRHPAAFASSLKRLNWPFDFKDLLDQPLLMRDWLAPFQQDMQKALAQADDIIGQSGLLWSILYQIMLRFQEIHSEFHVVRHEDLSNDPVNGYEKLYSDVGLHFSAKVRQVIARSSSPGNPKEIAQKNIYGTRVDSRANLDNWKLRLTSAEIKRLRHLTEAVASRFYTEEDWD